MQKKSQRKTKQITADLVSEHKLKWELNTQIADISGELATVTLTRKTFNAKATKQAGGLPIKRKAKATLKSEPSKKTSELAEKNS